MKLIPNMLSLLRGLIIAPLVLWFSLQYAWKIAFVLIVMGVITDALDGFLAIHWNVRTVIGSLFDSLSDCALILAIILGLSIAGIMPWWIFIFIIVAGLLFFFTERLCPPPISNISAGLSPFGGVSCHTVIGIMVAIQAFGWNTIYLFPPAVGIGLIVFKIKKERIRELLAKLHW